MRRGLLGCRRATPASLLRPVSSLAQGAAASVSLSKLGREVARAASAGDFSPALGSFRLLRSLSPQPPKVWLYNKLLNLALRSGRHCIVESLYKDLLIAGVRPDVYTCNILIESLIAANRLQDARRVFDQMRERLDCHPNEYTFGILIKGYCHCGQSMVGLELLHDMKRFNLHLNMVVCNTLVSAFCKEGKVEEAEKIIERMREEGLSPNVVTFNARVSALCKVGRVLEAYAILNDMREDKEMALPKPNLVTFNVMLSGFCDAGNVEEAAALVDVMRSDGFFRTIESYNRWLSGLVKNGKLAEAGELLDEMLRENLEFNVSTYNILISWHCKQGAIHDARVVVDIMRSNRVAPDVVTYTTLLDFYCSKGDASGANRVLHEMADAGCTANAFTHNIVLQSLWKEGRVLEAMQLLEKLNVEGFKLDVTSCNIVIDGLCKEGKLDEAIEIVDGLWKHGSAALGKLVNLPIGSVTESSCRQNCSPDKVTYLILIRELCKLDRMDEAKKKLLEMIGKGISPDSAIYDTFIHAYCRLGKVSSAFKVLRNMGKKGCSPSTKTYNLLMWGLQSKQHADNEILELTNEMKDKGLPFDIFTYNNMIRSLCEGKMVGRAIPLLDKMLQCGIVPNITSFSLLIRGLFRDGDIEAGMRMFQGALSTCGHKEALYNMMCIALCDCGNLVEAKEILEIAFDMRFTIRNLPYKRLIEDLCKKNMIEEAQSLLSMMLERRYRFDEAIFLPVIDLLITRGKKREADKLSEKMMEMATHSDKHDYAVSSNTNKMGYNIKRQKIETSPGSDWQSLLSRDDGPGIIMKVLKQIPKGRGQGSIPSSVMQTVDDFDE